MPVSFIEFTVSGPDQDQVSDSLSDFFQTAFNCRPEIKSAPPPQQQRPQPDDPGTKDFLGAAGLIVGLTTLLVTLPGAVLASLDLSDRMDKKKKLDELIDLAQTLHQQFPHTDITFKTDQGLVITLHQTSSGKILESHDR